MFESIHGHEVMKMMLEAGGTFTRASLKEAIIKKFGAKARFHTCSAADMSAEELIEFLSKKGKFSGNAEGFQTGADKICEH